MIASGFDWELTLKQCNRKKELAQELTDMLRGDLPKTQQALKKALSSQDTNTIYMEIHKLHGSCAYCGMPKLKSLIATLETEIKNDVVKDLAHSVTAINNEIDQVTADLKQLA
jgi:two-component system, NarL family, sensor histidine kinase BarA